ncbi:ABC transporter permease DevC [Spirulina subsalsa FACHB-351]|uniref:ABC transporter permease DevC n=1 Tax=Spirulina subsalsa FACHB-351 TaxID=234711 RepID=A0ABT3L8H8_9CYAN|nr:ABC transporter permease DevC [Spirulina subsalsa]MCW6037799.1 ABC transporter permease DevC [Spirulina subsalsa FACHB-351]
MNVLRRRTWLGWLQLSHEPSRLLVALAGIAFADVLMFMQLGFQASLFDSNTRLARTLNADVILVSPKAKNSQNLSTFSRRRLYQALDIPGVTQATALYSNLLTWKNPQTRQDTVVQLIGFDPDHTPFDLPDLKTQQDLLKLPDVVVFDRRSRGKYGEVISQLEEGTVVTTEAEGRTLSIQGIFSLGASFGADGTLLTSDQTFLRILPRRNRGSISLGLLQLAPEANPAQVVAQLRARLPEDVNVFTQEEFIAAEKRYWQTESPIGFIFTMGTAMAFVVGVVIVYQVLSTDVNAHLQEYATFKAMGYRHRYLLGVIFEEAVILALLGFIPGFILPIGLYRVAARATALPIAMTVHRALMVLGLTLIMCLLSGAIATRRLQGADPADMF